MGNLWFIVVGVLLMVIALSGSVLKRLPLSTALVYLFAGVVLSRVGALQFSPVEHAHTLERLTEVAVVISLFCAGLKLRLPMRHHAWRLPVRLAIGAMVLTVGLLTLAGMALGLSLAAAVLLGAILAPTDPVLASDVQVAHAMDTDALRFGLTGEAGLNDGSAFPFVMLGLGLLGLHPLGEYGWRWVAVDVVWAVVVGICVGAVLGGAVGRLVLYLRRTHKEAVGLDDFLALGLIALSYGVAVAAHGYGFLAVFAAGVALRRVESRSNRNRSPDEVAAGAVAGRETDVATHPDTAPAFMAQAVLGFAEQLERLGEVALMVLVGALLDSVGLGWEGVVLALVLFLVLRPLSVAVVSVGSRTTRGQRVLMGWFGIRGIGSLYYLFFAMTHGLQPGLAEQLMRLVLTVVAVSAVLHGVSVTPLMTAYGRRRERSEQRRKLREAAAGA